MEQFLTSRRQALMLLMTAAAASRAQESLPPIMVAGKRSMIVHNDMPEDLESPVSYLNQWLTPTDSFSCASICRVLEWKKQLFSYALPALWQKSGLFG